MTLYAAHHISLALLEEHDLCVLHRPTYKDVWNRVQPWARAYGVVIECRTPIEHWDALPDGVAQAKINELRARWLCNRTHAFAKPLWLEWDAARKLFCAPEHIAACKSESWPHIGVDFVREHLGTQWMTYEKPPIMGGSMPPVWGKPRFMPSTVEKMDAQVPRDIQPVKPTQIIIHTHERNCGHCPISLACIRGHALAYPSDFYFTMCPRCHCLHFDKPQSGILWLCAILRWRNEEDAEAAVRRAVFGPEMRGLLTAGLSCVSKWQRIEDFERIGPNKLMPAHPTKNKGWYRREREWPVSTYDCVDYLQELAATEDTPLVVY